MRKDIAASMVLLNINIDEYIDSIGCIIHVVFAVVQLIFFLKEVTSRFQVLTNIIL